jgi:hypothetical protein
MADLVDRIRRELDARIEQLRPLVGEFERLERAAAALARCGARAVPGLGARPSAPAAAKPGSKPAGRSTRAKSAGRKPPAKRRGTASGRPPAQPQSRPAGRSPRAKSAARKPPAAPRGAASGLPPAPRGQTQARVLAALRAAPGSTSAAVATAAGVPTNVAAATISRLVRQGRVRRLEEGGYAPVETPAGAARLGVAPVSTDAAAVASDTPGAAAPVATDAETPG